MYIVIKENEPLGQHILFRAKQSGESVEKVVLKMLRESFEKTACDLHQNFMRGEFTQGELAAMLGIERIDLIHLLDDLGLTATNV